MRLLETMTIAQNRETWPVYRSVTDPNFKPGDWGRPVTMAQANEITLQVKVHLVYVEEDRPLIKELMDVLRDICEADKARKLKDTVQEEAGT